MSRRHRVLAGSAAALLASCAHYTPRPLPAAAQLAPSVEVLSGHPAPSQPLSVEDVVSLVLVHNPDLIAARARRAVAAGQALQAGILPNPQITGAFLPLLSGPGTVPAWNLGLAQNVKALITYRPMVRAARDTAAQVAADVVWQEWQTAGKARQLAADWILTDRSRPSYAAVYDLLVERNRKLDVQLAAGNVTLTIAAPDRVALQSARAALDAVEQKRLSLRHQLNALLGLTPDAELRLMGTPDLPPFDAERIAAGLPTLPQRRPDLLALRLGYAAADENVRRAILAQFPDFILGGAIASDNSKVINAGPNATLGLPIFDRNQGDVAITRATREQLHAEYTARLAATTGEISAMMSEIRQLEDQLAIARRELPAAEEAAHRAELAFGAANLDERGFVDLVTNRSTKEQEIMTLEQALLDRRIAVQTLAGEGLPTANLPAEPTSGAAR